MYKEIEAKINEIITIFNENQDIKHMIKLKKELLEDKNITILLEEYKSLLKNPYDKRCIAIKKELLNHPKFSKYKRYEEELYLLVLNINSKLKEILKEKSCYK